MCPSAWDGATAAITTRSVILPVDGGIEPDGTGSGNNPAEQIQVISSGSQTSNSPKASYWELRFDPTTEEHWMWQFTLPANYLSGGTLRLTGATLGTSASQVVWKAATAIVVVGTTDRDAIVFDTVVTVAWTPSTTQGVTTQATVALTMTNALANRPITIFIGRDTDNGSDTNANDACLVEAVFEYVAA